mmetsp:Transcript_16306/g.55520  ORF Transcript_16306/g.55520 Transcript_16306/m.55520 type:complete len:281 (+) Transcript_16306:178-1020(+)
MAHLNPQLQKMVDKLNKDAKRASKALTTIAKEKEARSHKRQKVEPKRDEDADVKVAAAAPSAAVGRKRQQAINTYIRTVLNTLMEHRRPMSAREIMDACKVDVLTNKTLFTELRDNPKAHYDEPTQTWEYKAKYNVKGRDGLLALVGKTPEGLPWADIKDLYNGIGEDLHALHAEGRLYLIRNIDTGKEVVYPRERRFEVNVDEDIVDLWNGVEVPTDENELKQMLADLGLPVAERKSKSQYRPSNERRKKIRRQATRQAKLQNTHVSDLLSDGPPSGMK